ncbi:MAG: hypothetical protein ACI9W4_002298 [Rhodothermales bacterium]|jgi:hypothetical protein
MQKASVQRWVARRLEDCVGLAVLAIDSAYRFRSDTLPWVVLMFT